MKWKPPSHSILFKVHGVNRRHKCSVRNPISLPTNIRVTEHEIQDDSWKKRIQFSASKIVRIDFNNRIYASKWISSTGNWTYTNLYNAVSITCMHNLGRNFKYTTELHFILHIPFYPARKQEWNNDNHDDDLSILFVFNYTLRNLDYRVMVG
jgi:hypothetical protein